MPSTTAEARGKASGETLKEVSGEYKRGHAKRWGGG